MASSSLKSAGSGTRRITAVLVLQLGAIAAVLAATPFKLFDLERFFIPKELVLHTAAFLCVLLCIDRLRTVKLDRVDFFLIAFAVLSVVSALLATNRWLSTRSVAITLSGLAVFWCARALSASGFRRAIIGTVVFATVLGAATSLAQAYGIESDYFTLSRAPGGTFGNRNFVAHVSAIGVPLLIWYAVTARRLAAVILCGLGGAVLSAALVLSRSRAAWLALLVVALLLAVPIWRAAARVTHADAGRRLAFLGLVAAVAILLALLLPNHLNWKSDSPYLDSVRGVVAYNSGSGRGRVIQYRNTLHMAEAHPVLGVGPGNWGVHYPLFAATNDPSLSHDDRTTANAWPSSDWAAMLAERGPIAVLALLLAFLGIVANSVQADGRGESERDRDPFLPMAVTATVLVTGAVGAFDAVIILAAPALVVWTALGALGVPGRVRWQWTPGRTARNRLAAALVVPLFLFSVRSAGSTLAMKAFGTGQRISSVSRAAMLDPGSYRIQVRLALLELNSGHCSAALAPARRAAAMLPEAHVPRRILGRCGYRKKSAAVGDG
jgi:O-antigen ligase